MKIFLLPILLHIFSFSDYHSAGLSFVIADTSHISHVLDGNTTEWPKNKFEIDNETNTQLASDNDNRTLFVAIRISDKEMQKKIIIQGMYLYIDAKGKKKETKGIEFPVKMEGNVDPSLSLINMKLFGFTSLEPFVQSVQTEGTVNIAAAWDSLNILHIEYNIPFILLGDLQDLQNKKISMGLKWTKEEITVNKTSGATSNSGYTTTQLVGVPAGSRPNTARPSVPAPTRVVDPTPQSAKTHSFWRAHTIIF